MSHDDALSVNEHRAEGVAHLVRNGLDVFSVHDLHEQQAVIAAHENFMCVGMEGGFGRDFRLYDVGAALRI